MLNNDSILYYITNIISNITKNNILYYKINTPTMDNLLCIFDLLILTKLKQLIKTHNQKTHIMIFHILFTIKCNYYYQEIMKGI